MIIPRAGVLGYSRETKIKQPKKKTITEKHTEISVTPRRCQAVFLLWSPPMVPSVKGRSQACRGLCLAGRWGAVQLLRPKQGAQRPAFCCPEQDRGEVAISGREILVGADTSPPFHRFFRHSLCSPSSWGWTWGTESPLHLGWTGFLHHSPSILACRSSGLVFRPAISQRGGDDLHRLRIPLVSRKSLTDLKEQCHEIFRFPFFFNKQLLLFPICMPRNDFEFFRKFVELFIFVIDSPAMNTPGSRLESFRFSSLCKQKSHVPRELK